MVNEIIEWEIESVNLDKSIAGLSYKIRPILTSSHFSIFQLIGLKCFAIVKLLLILTFFGIFFIRYIYLKLIVIHFCILESFNNNILHQLLYYKIIFVNSQLENANSKGEFVLKTGLF